MIVRLHIGHLGEAPPHLLDSPASFITLTQGEPIFVPVASFLVAMMSFAALQHTYSTGNSAPWGPDHLFVLDAASAGHRIRVRGQSVAQAIITNHWPQTIELGLDPLTKPYDGDNRLGALQTYVYSALQGMFTSFYEDNKSVIENKFGTVATWPSVWNFGRVVRNALSHGGNLNITHPGTVSWRSLTYAQIDHGSQLIFADLWPGDVLILMKEMQDAMP